MQRKFSGENLTFEMPENFSREIGHFQVKNAIYFSPEKRNTCIAEISPEKHGRPARRRAGAGARDARCAAPSSTRRRGVSTRGRGRARCAASSSTRRRGASTRGRRRARCAASSSTRRRGVSTRGRGRARCAVWYEISVSVFHMKSQCFSYEILIFHLKS